MTYHCCMQAAELESLIDCWRQQQHETSLMSSTLRCYNSDKQTSITSGNNLQAKSAAPSASAIGDHSATQRGLLNCSNNSSSLGVVSISKLSLGLVLNQSRFQKLLTDGITSPHLIANLSESYGQLFTASLATQCQQQQGAASLACNGQPQHSVGVLQIATNDMTCIRAGLEHASFASAVTPGAAVRLAHIVVLAVALKFLGSNNKSLGKINQVLAAGPCFGVCMAFSVVACLQHSSQSVQALQCRKKT